MKATQEQIKKWKKQHGEVFQITVEDKSCYLHKPSRKTLSYASSVGANNPIKFNEIIIEGCWIAGDEDLKKDDSYFLAVSAHIGELVEVKEAELVKL